jgi:GT2 family glycosyltransferase
MRIFYSNPFRTDKNIGKAYNDFIKSLNAQDEDWIVLQDGDIMYLTPDWGKRIEDALVMEGEKFGLIGCYTNRLNSKWQLHQNNFSEEMDIRKHYEIAISYNDEGIEEYKHIVAGCWMAFQYKIWKKIGGFIEKNISCDAIFNSQVRDLGLKIGLIKSLYVFHLYRIWSDGDPRNERKHLK